MNILASYTKKIISAGKAFLLIILACAANSALQGAAVEARRLQNRERILPALHKVLLNHIEDNNLPLFKSLLTRYPELITYSPHKSIGLEFDILDELIMRQRTDAKIAPFTQFTISVSNQIRPHHLEKSLIIPFIILCTNNDKRNFDQYVNVTRFIFDQVAHKNLAPEGHTTNISTPQQWMQQTVLSFLEQPICKVCKIGWKGHRNRDEALGEKLVAAVGMRVR